MQRQTGTADGGDNICAISDAAAGDLPSLVSCNSCLWLLPKKGCWPRDSRATRKSGQLSVDGERPDQGMKQPQACSCSRSPLSGPSAFNPLHAVCISAHRCAPTRHGSDGDPTATQPREPKVGSENRSGAEAAQELPSVPPARKRREECDGALAASRTSCARFAGLIRCL